MWISLRMRTRPIGGDRWSLPWRNYRRGIGVLVATLFAIALGAAIIPRALAQEPDAGDEMNGPPMLPPVSTPDDSDQMPAMPLIPMRQPVSGTLMVAPPYGNAPLKVGFFVLANDPENIGFLTYQWNFGDGSVSSLPPELYIFHTYATPGNYLCTLVVKTVDGRSMTMMQGVVVVPVTD
jgi:PKD domain